MVGLAVIDSRGLYFYLVDFPSLSEKEAVSRLGFGHHHRPVFLAVAAWFVFTALAAVWAARAKKFALHQARAASPENSQPCTPRSSRLLGPGWHHSPA